MASIVPTSVYGAEGVEGIIGGDDYAVLEDSGEDEEIPGQARDDGYYSADDGYNYDGGYYNDGGYDADYEADYEVDEDDDYLEADAVVPAPGIEPALIGISPFNLAFWGGPADGLLQGEVDSWAGSFGSLGMGTVDIDGTPSGTLTIPPFTEVTIVGSATTTSPFILMIDATSTVIFNGQITSGATLNTVTLGGVAGVGELIINGTIENTAGSGNAIMASATDVIVNTGAMVSSTGNNGRAINAFNSAVTVNGGTVQATGTGGIAIGLSSGATANIIAGIIIPPLPDAPPGAGTLGSPWQISTLEHWIWMRAATAQVATPTLPQRMAGHYQLMNNLDATSLGNNVMVGDGAVANAFTGNFDGFGHTVQVAINGSFNTPVGLFRRVGAGGVVENITVGGNVQNTVGGVVGETGGLVGINTGGTIRNALSTAVVTSTGTVGGLVGLSQTGSTIEYSSATGNVSNTSDGMAGGLVGGNSAMISRSFATGNVSSGAPTVGGLVANNAGTIQDSYATGNVSGTLSIGGLVGVNTPIGVIVRSYATGNVSGTGDVGGLAGTNSNTAANAISQSIALNGNISITPTSVTTIGRIWGGGPGNGSNNFAHQHTQINGAAFGGTSSQTNQHGATTPSLDLQAQTWWANATTLNLSVSTTTGTTWFWRGGTTYPPVLNGFSGITQNPQPPTGVSHVPVTNITGVPTTATVGTALTLSGTVVPSTATNQTITWSVFDAGTTGATISGGNSLNTTAPGTAVVRATITNGATASTPYTQDFNITVSAAFVAVTNITGLPTAATVGTPLTLTGTVVPSTATNQAITWSVQNAAGTGATITGGNSFNATSAGTAVVRATITNGATASTPYTQDFNIAVSAGFVAVTNITGLPTTAMVGTPLTLSGTVVPSTATNQAITWSVQNAGTTGASITGGNTLNTTGAGTAVLTATVVNGATATTPFTHNFNVVVSATPTVPSAPQNLTAVAGNGHVNLTWNPPANSGSSPITGYQVSLDGTNWTATPNTSGLFTGLTNGVSFTFRVRAVNIIGHGPEATVTSTPMASVTPTPTPTPTATATPTPTVTPGPGAGGDNQGYSGQRDDMQAAPPWTSTHAQRPSIPNNQPGDVTVNVGGDATLSVNVSNITDGGVVTYQWYRAEGARGGSFVRVQGATEREFSPNTDNAGVNRYRVTVTNTNNATRIDGNRIVRSTSRAAVVTVTAPGAAAVPSPTHAPAAAQAQAAILPDVRVELSNGLAAQLQGLLGDGFNNLDINVGTSASNTNGGFVTADISFSVSNAELNNTLNSYLPYMLQEPNAYYTIVVDLSGFMGDGQNRHRVVAIHNGAVVGGGISNPDTVFSVDASTMGQFTIAYVANLRRLVLSPDSHNITDLAGNMSMQTMDVLPVIQDGRVMIPIRFIAEALGADVSWTPSADGRASTIHIGFNGQTLSFGIGELTPELAALGMDVPAQIVDDRTMVPLRFVSEFFGATVDWNSQSRSIGITGYGTAGSGGLLSLWTNEYEMMPAREEEDASGAPAVDADDIPPDPELEHYLSEQRRMAQGLLSLAELRALGILK